MSRSNNIATELFNLVKDIKIKKYYKLPRCLTLAWKPKITTIKSDDTTTLTLESLARKLKMYETHQGEIKS